MKQSPNKLKQRIELGQQLIGKNEARNLKIRTDIAKLYLKIFKDTFNKLNWEFCSVHGMTAKFDKSSPLSGINGHIYLTPRRMYVYTNGLGAGDTVYICCDYDWSDEDLFILDKLGVKCSDPNNHFGGEILKYNRKINNYKDDIALAESSIKRLEAIKSRVIK